MTRDPSVPPATPPAAAGLQEPPRRPLSLLRFPCVGPLLVSLAALAGVVLLALWMRVELGPRRADDALAQRCGVDSALALAVDSVWGRFLAGRDGRAPTIPELRLYLDRLGLTDAGAQAEPARVDLLGAVDLQRDDRGRFALAGAVIDLLDVAHRDSDQTTRLLFRARAPAAGPAGEERALERRLELEIRLE